MFLFTFFFYLYLYLTNKLITLFDYRLDILGFLTVIIKEFTQFADGASDGGVADNSTRPNVFVQFFQGDVAVAIIEKIKEDLLNFRFKGDLIFIFVQQELLLGIDIKTSYF